MCRMEIVWLFSFWGRLEAWKNIFEGLHKSPPNQQEIEQRKTELISFEKSFTPAEKQNQLFGKILFPEHLAENQE